MTKRIFLISCLAVATAPACASDVWSVVEGQQGAVKGNWLVATKGDEITATAKMAGPAGEVTYNVSGKSQNGVFLLKRTAASDHLDCAYQGAMKGDGSIAGASICGGRSGPWIAHPAKK